MSPRVTVYSTTWCGHCRRLARRLDDAGIPYVEVDVDKEPAHARRIVEKTGGYRTVPTVEIGGELLVNPSLSEVESALAAVEAARSRSEAT